MYDLKIQLAENLEPFSGLVKLNSMKPVYYSCVVDASPKFYYQAWNLVHSLLEISSITASQIFVHHTQEVENFFIEEIKKLGVQLTLIERFGDGKYCNKIEQLETTGFEDAECVFFLDSDLIVLDELMPIYHPGKISGKIVDLPNPSIDQLKEIFTLAGFVQLPEIQQTDCSSENTFLNNLNGGLYAIPGNLIPQLKICWKKWALWLIDNIKILEVTGHQNHVDQISFSLATFELNIPVFNVDKKYNFPAHLDIAKSGRPSVIHYHNLISKTGLLDIKGQCDTEFTSAVDSANKIISKNFNNKVFWSFRYHQYPELGSGVGSRGDILEYKLQLLRDYKIEDSPSVLDVGCGDLEVLQSINFNNYTGVDVSPYAISRAKEKRPDLNFILLDSDSESKISKAHTVLCFEVLIHQQTKQDYLDVVEFLAEHTMDTLIASGYTQNPQHHETNHMINYYESLIETLERTGKFSKINSIGKHSGVEVILAKV